MFRYMNKMHPYMWTYTGTSENPYIVDNKYYAKYGSDYLFFPEEVNELWIKLKVDMGGDTNVTGKVNFLIIYSDDNKYMFLRFGGGSGNRTMDIAYNNSKGTEETIFSFGYTTGKKLNVFAHIKQGDAGNDSVELYESGRLLSQKEGFDFFGGKPMKKTKVKYVQDYYGLVGNVSGPTFGDIIISSTKLYKTEELFEVPMVINANSEIKYDIENKFYTGKNANDKLIMSVDKQRFSEMLDNKTQITGLQMAGYRGFLDGRDTKLGMYVNNNKIGDADVDTNANTSEFIGITESIPMNDFTNREYKMVIEEA